MGSITWLRDRGSSWTLVEYKGALVEKARTMAMARTAYIYLFSFLIDGKMIQPKRHERNKMTFVARGLVDRR